MPSRRDFLGTAAGVSALAALGGAGLPAWAASGTPGLVRGRAALSGNRFDLTVQESPFRVAGRTGRAVTVNGHVPAPLLRWREGEEVTLRVTNRLDVDTSIHWHGILLPYEMDGVPGVTFPGIKPGETFADRFPVAQAGTYWYHSHSGLQEQAGHYGPLVIDPAGPDRVAYDREHVLVLSDWTFEDPHRVFARLKKQSHAYNFQERTVFDFTRDAGDEGLVAALAERMAWGRMRMNPADIADVTAATYTYLVNGHGPDENWTGLFAKDERVRLRLINASAMTIFNVRLPGLPMTVVQADGLDVKPAVTDELQIGVAETFDVIVTPADARAYTLMAESIDRSGYTRATLAPRAGMAAPVPALRQRPTLTMKDMGMGGHGDMNHNQMDHSQMDHDAGEKAAIDPGMHTRKDMGLDRGMDRGAPYPHNHPKGPGVVGLARNPVNRLHEPGLGLDGVDHRVLVYADLESLAPNPDTRAPGRELELHLTSNMDRYMWSFDGVKFSEVDGPIDLYEGERVRLTLVNDTMMAHPIHLHGMFFDLVTHAGAHKPRKHTVVAKPGEKLSVDITADAVGYWAFHCHLLYHMHAGMMRVVAVHPRARTADRPAAEREHRDPA